MEQISNMTTHRLGVWSKSDVKRKAKFERQRAIRSGTRKNANMHS